MKGAVFAAIAATVGCFLQGWDNACIAGATVYITKELNLGTNLEGLVVAMSLIGATLITTCSGLISDYIGRRPMLILSAVFYFIGGLIMFWSPNVYILLVARLLDGFGMGLAVTLVPVYISETAPSDIRGTLNTLPQFTGTCGLFFAYCMIFGMSLSESPSWRIILGVLSIPSLVYFILAVFYLPESPRWLVSKGRMVEAARVLQMLCGNEDVSGEMALLIKGLTIGGEPLIGEYITRPDDQTGEPLIEEYIIGSDDQNVNLFQMGWKGSIWSALLEPGVKRALIVGMGIQLLQQFSGNHGILYYTPQILEKAGVKVLLANLGIGSTSASFLISGLITLLMLPSIGVAMRLMDVSGRRTLLLTTIPVLTVSLIILVIANSIRLSEVLNAIISTTCVVFYFCCFVMAFGPIPNILCSEIFPTRVRGLCIAICALVFWLSDITVTYTLPVMLTSIGLRGIFGIYAIVCVISWVFIFFKVPETKGMPLEVISCWFLAG